jgi:hypothetical protein
VYFNGQWYNDNEPPYEKGPPDLPQVPQKVPVPPGPDDDGWDPTKLPPWEWPVSASRDLDTAGAAATAAAPAILVPHYVAALHSRILSESRRRAGHERGGIR